MLRQNPTKKIKLGDESLVAISMSDAASMFGVSSNVIAKRIKIVTRRLFVSKDKKERSKNRYHQLVEKIFFDKYVDGDLEVFV
nr:hypothetical protein [Klebsiella pneumoniae]